MASPCVGEATDGYRGFATPIGFPLDLPDTKAPAHSDVRKVAK